MLLTLWDSEKSQKCKGIAMGTPHGIMCWSSAAHDVSASDTRAGWSGNSTVAVIYSYENFILFTLIYFVVSVDRPQLFLPKH
jgi:hypothetical protein